MLELSRAANLVNVRQMLSDIWAGTSIQGISAEERFQSWMVWAEFALNRLRYTVPPEELDRLIRTSAYRSMFGRNPADFGTTLALLVNNEVAARETAFRAELGMFDAVVQEWHGGAAVAVVPDTSVLLQFGGDFPEHPWHETLGIRPDIPVMLVVTMVAVSELDRAKLSRDASGPGQLKRSRAQAALRRIEELFPNNDERRVFETPGAIVSRVTTYLMTDPLAHVPLISPDAEMIARARSLLPYAARSIMVTYDVAQTFRARAAGIESHRMRYPDEAAS